MENEIWVAAGTIIGTALGSYVAYRNVSDRRHKETRALAEDIKRHTTVQVAKANGLPWSFVENCPLPTWCKDLNGVMQWINNEYEQQWGIKSSMYEGRTDYDVWPNDVAAAFRRHDQLVAAQGRTLLTIEDVPNSIQDPNGPRTQWKIWKFPVRDNYGQIVGIGGIAAIASNDETCHSSPVLIDKNAEELWLAEPKRSTEGE